MELADAATIAGKGLQRIEARNARRTENSVGVD
jgi:hypothetical protein